MRQNQSTQGMPSGPITDGKGNLTATWLGYLNQVDFFVSGIGNTGTTAQRPGNTNNQLFAGFSYFDTTLGYMVWVKTINPLVWVNASGTPV